MDDRTIFDVSPQMQARAEQEVLDRFGEGARKGIEQSRAKLAAMDHARKLALQAEMEALNAELLTGMLAKPESWSSAFMATPDGLALREGNAFGSMLGMTSSDRVLQANGVALRSSEDVLVAFLRPLVANQAVRVSGIRGGKPTDWIFVNATGCP